MKIQNKNCWNQLKRKELNCNLKRLEERRMDFENAFKRLEEALKENETEIAIDGTLHRSEFTFELAWKTMKDYLEYHGVIENTGSPREIIKVAFKQGLIAEGEDWIQMMLSRNSLSHLYDEKTSRQIYDLIKNKYVYLLKDILEKV